MVGKSLFLTAPRQLAWISEELPSIGPQDVLTPAFHEKELHIVGSSDGWDYTEHAAWYFREVLRQPTYLEQLFDLHITCEELPSTFEQLATGATQPVKVLVNYLT